MNRYLVTVKTRDGIAVFNRVMVDAPDQAALNAVMDDMKVEAGNRCGMPDPLNYFRASYEAFQPTA